MILERTPEAQYDQINSNTTLKSEKGRLFGIFVSAASSTPTITVYDNTSNSGTEIVAQFTPSASTMYSFGEIRFDTGLTVQIGGTVECSVFYK